MDHLVALARRWGRRRLLRIGLAVAGTDLLAGCGDLPLPGRWPARVPRIGFLAVGSREGLAIPPSVLQRATEVVQ